MRQINKLLLPEHTLVANVQVLQVRSDVLHHVLLIRPFPLQGNHLSLGLLSERKPVAEGVFARGVPLTSAGQHACPDSLKCCLGSRLEFFHHLAHVSEIVNLSLGWRGALVQSDIRPEFLILVAYWKGFMRLVFLKAKLRVGPLFAWGHVGCLLARYWV